MATKKELRDMEKVKHELIRAIGNVGHNVTCRVVFAALIQVTVDAGIIMVGRETMVQAICSAVNAYVLNSRAQQVK